MVLGCYPMGKKCTSNVNYTIFANIYKSNCDVSSNNRLWRRGLDFNNDSKNKKFYIKFGPRKSRAANK